MSTIVARWPVPVMVGAAGGSLLVALSAWLSPVVALVALAGAVVAGVLAVFPYLGLVLAAAVVPLERIGRVTNDSSMYTFSLMRAIGLITLAGLIVHVAITRRAIRVPFPLRAYGLYVAVGLFALSYTTDWAYGVRAASAVLGNVMFLFVIVNLIRTPAQARIAIACWLAMTTLIGAFTVYQWHDPSAVVAEDAFNATGERTSSERFATVLHDASEYQVLDKAPRALGSSSHPAVYGINVILTLPFFAVAFRTFRGRLAALAIAGAGALACYNVFLTNTRAAIVALVVTLALIVWTGLVRVTRGGILAAALAVGVGLAAVPASLYERVFDPSNYTLERSDTMRARLIYWEEGLSILGEHWLTGVGLGNQTELPSRLAPRMHMPPNSTVHNEYLQSLIETGVLGYPLLIALMVGLYRICREGETRFRQAGDRDTALLMIACRVALLSVLFYGVQVDVLHFPLKGWWLAMGIATALVEQARAGVLSSADVQGAIA